MEGGGATEGLGLENKGGGACMDTSHDGSEVAAGRRGACGRRPEERG
jgi:hypothetical protein